MDATARPMAFDFFRERLKSLEQHNRDLAAKNVALEHAIQAMQNELEVYRAHKVFERLDRLEGRVDKAREKFQELQKEIRNEAI